MKYSTKQTRKAARTPVYADCASIVLPSWSSTVERNISHRLTASRGMKQTAATARGFDSRLGNIGLMKEIL